VTDDPAIGEILVGAEDLSRRVRELAAEISRDYQGKDLLLIGVLKGAVFFVSDLMRYLEIPVEVDFMAVASYGSATRSSGVVRILKDLDAAIEGRDVLIVEDIVDSGLTLQYLLRNLAGRNPRSLEVCALLIKPDRRKVDLQTRYVGFEIPDRFAIGYGLDHAERYRTVPPDGPRRRPGPARSAAEPRLDAQSRLLRLLFRGVTAIARTAATADFSI
jgi:hypoxanthine phosphoribosyltransferase